MRADPDGPSTLREPTFESTIRIVLDRMVTVEFAEFRPSSTRTPVELDGIALRAPHVSRR